MTTRTAGPDYWFVDSTYAEVDRLTDDECPMDEIAQAADAEAIERYFEALHSLRCPLSGMGDHAAENCPAGGV